MLSITTLSPRAIEIVAEGRFTAADVGPALNRLWSVLDEMPRLDILADIRGSPSIALSAITEEVKHLPSLFRVIRQVERVAIVADAGWVRAVSKIESALIPGVRYEVYERHEAAHAREWLLRVSVRSRPCCTITGVGGYAVAIEPPACNPWRYGDLEAGNDWCRILRAYRSGNGEWSGNFVIPSGRPPL